MIDLTLEMMWKVFVVHDRVVLMRLT